MKLEPYLTYTKVNSKWIHDLNIKHGTCREINIGEWLLDIDLGNDFFGYDHKSTGNTVKKANGIAFK